MDKAEDVWNLSRDPQGELYARNRQRHLEGVRAGSEARGLNMGPYGAGVENEAMKNYELDWERELFNRLLSGSQQWQNLMGGAQDIASAGYDNSIRYGESLFRDPEAGGGSTSTSRTSNYAPTYSQPSTQTEPSTYSSPYTDTAGALERHKEYLRRQMERITGGLA
jgi:hypothetical protein